MSRSFVFRADPCRITATPPTITKSTSASVSRVISFDAWSSGGIFATSSSAGNHQLPCLFVERFEAPQPLLGRELELRPYQRLINPRILARRREHQPVSGCVQHPLESRNRWVGPRCLQPRDRRLRRPEPSC